VIYDFETGMKNLASKRLDAEKRDETRDETRPLSDKPCEVDISQ
jgi:hypothetical protein